MKCTTKEMYKSAIKAKETVQTFGQLLCTLERDLKLKTARKRTRIFTDYHIHDLYFSHDRFLVTSWR